MEIITLFLIAIGLSFDTFAVSISTGLIVNTIRFIQAVRFAIILAVSQAIMPVIGWFTGVQIKDAIIEFDHWIAFSLLLMLGLKMIFESFKKEEERKNFNPLRLITAIGIAIATSIDALVVGVSFAFLNTNIVIAVFIIGSTTFFVSMLGMLFGKKTGAHLGKKMEIVGGLILIGIGLKILIQHLLE